VDQNYILIGKRAGRGGGEVKALKKIAARVMAVLQQSNHECLTLELVRNKRLLI
jgi:hypothetical protein